jgi:type IV pilus assembly protein PilQ
MVTVNNGQTVVLGGVYEIESKDDLSKIPLFGDIPLLGNLFKHSSKNEAKGELMIFITPYIIEEADLDETGKEEKPNEITLNKK